VATKPQSKPVPAAYSAAGDSRAKADPTAERLSRGADSTAERLSRGAIHPPQDANPSVPGADPAADLSHQVSALEQSVESLRRTAESLLARQGRTVKLATASLRDAYPFPDPHFSADVVTSQVDKARPVGSQKAAELTYQESTGLLAVRGVRRTGEPWVCLIPASNIKGMRVLEEG
jgi:hypothetical protein